MLSINFILKILFVATYFFIALRIFVKCAFAGLYKLSKQGGNYDFANNRESLPFVSVVIPAYNASSEIVNVLGSLKKSDYPFFEIIVIDDGSIDNTVDFVEEELKDFARKVIIKLSTNQGKVTALNSGISIAQGEIVFTLDADTIIAPKTLSLTICHMLRSNAVACACNVKIYKPRNLITMCQDIEYMTLNLERRAQAVFNLITIVPGAASAWYRQDLIDSGGFSSRTVAEDSDMTIRLLRDGGKIIFVEEAVAYTAAPQCVEDLITQRTRWSYGSAQCILLHWKEILSKSTWKLKYVGFPNYILSNSLRPFIPILLISLNLLLYIHGSNSFLLVGNFILLSFEIGKIIVGLFLDSSINLTHVYSVPFYLVTFPFIHLVSFLRGGVKRSAGIMFEWQSKELKSNN